MKRGFDLGRAAVVKIKGGLGLELELLVVVLAGLSIHSARGIISDEELVKFHQ